MGTKLAVAAGLASGIVGAWGGLWLFHGALAPKQAVAAPPTSSGSTSIPTGGQFDEASQCRMRAAMAAAATTDSSGSPRPTEAPLDLPKEEQMKVDAEAIQELHRNRLVAHNQEPRDARWASAKEASLSDGFTALVTATSSKLQKVDCRSVSCVATFIWPNEAKAREEMYTVVSRTASFAGDAVKYFTLEGTDSSGHSTASMVIDWTETTDGSASKP
jgi:hypothetical protein